MLTYLIFGQLSIYWETGSGSMYQTNAWEFILLLKLGKLSSLIIFLVFLLNVLMLMSIRVVLSEKTSKQTWYVYIWNANVWFIRYPQNIIWNMQWVGRSEQIDNLSIIKVCSQKKYLLPLTHTGALSRAPAVWGRVELSRSAQK